MVLGKTAETVFAESPEFGWKFKLTGPKFSCLVCNVLSQ